MLGFPHPMTPRKGTRMAARNSPRRLAVVVLAAGKGKRMKSSRPKVLHEVSGRPSLWHVLQAAMAGRPDRLVVVVHHGADEVRAAAEAWKLKPSPVFVEQEEALGTGHAAAAAEEAVRRADDVLVPATIRSSAPRTSGPCLRPIAGPAPQPRSPSQRSTTPAGTPEWSGRATVCRG
jgi:bifunctional UDP-N-acetylglucosamine pyrophosphorylase/glucosamine-1-phosphate N-acetyltransferase